MIDFISFFVLAVIASILVGTFGAAIIALLGLTDYTQYH